MELIHPRCAGLDVSKRDAKVCVRVAGGGRAGTKSTVTTWSAMTNQVLALREHLIEARVTLVVIAPFRHVRDLLITIPGISNGVADVVIAETGADMTRFPSAAHLASWAGTSLGSNESAGRVKSTHTRPGDPYLKGALGIAAMSVVRHPSTSGYLGAKFRRIASRPGPMKAIVAVEHATLIAIWNMITTDT